MPIKGRHYKWLYAGLLTGLFALAANCGTAFDGSGIRENDDIRDSLNGIGHEPIGELSSLPQVGQADLKGEARIDFSYGVWGEAIGGMFSNDMRLEYLFARNNKLKEWQGLIGDKKILVVLDSFYPVHKSPGAYFDLRFSVENAKSSLEEWEKKYDYILLALLPVRRDLYQNRSLSVEQWNSKLDERTRIHVKKVFELGLENPSEQDLQLRDEINSLIKTYGATKGEKFRILNTKDTFQNLVADGLIRGNDNLDYTLSDLFTDVRSLSELGQEFILNKLVIPTLEEISKELRQSSLDSKKSLMPLVLPRFGASLGHVTSGWIEEFVASNFKTNSDFSSLTPGKYLFELENLDGFFSSAKYFEGDEGVGRFFKGGESNLSLQALSNVQSKLSAERVFLHAILESDGKLGIDLGKLVDRQRYSYRYASERQDGRGLDLYYFFSDQGGTKPSFNHILKIDLPTFSAPNFKFYWILIPSSIEQDKIYREKVDSVFLNEFERGMFLEHLAGIEGEERVVFSGLLKVTGQ